MTPTESAMPIAANPNQNSNGIMTSPLNFLISFVDAFESSNEYIVWEGEIVLCERSEE